MDKYFKKIMSITLAAAMVITSFAFANTKVNASDVNVQAQRNVMATVYVATTGNDTSGDGSQDNPFATLQRAQQAVRQINQNMKGNIIVSIAPGDYYMPSTLNLTPQDSGSNGYNIIWESSDGIGAAKLIGGIPVDPNGWTQTTQSDVTNFGMLTRMVGKVWKTQLNKANYSNTTFTGLYSPGFNTLYVDDQRATLARTPNLDQRGFATSRAGYNRTTGGRNSNYNATISTNSLTAAEINGLNLAASNGMPNIASFHGFDGSGWDWDTVTEPVISYNSSIGELKFPNSQTVNAGGSFWAVTQYMTKYNIGGGSRYFLQDNLAFLDTPDEYYYDKKNGVLYYYPSDETMTNKTVVTPTMQTVINMQGAQKANPGDVPDPSNQVHNIVINGLTVKDTDCNNYYSELFDQTDGGSNNGITSHPPEAIVPGVTNWNYDTVTERPDFRVGIITMDGTNHVTITNTHVKNGGINGIMMQSDNQYNTIENTTIEEVGLMGLYIDGGYPGVGKYSNNNTIYNVLIHDVGQLEGTGSGLVLMDSGYNNISHMEIYNAPRRGIWITSGYGGYTRTTYDPVRDNAVVGNHFSYLYVHDCEQDSGEDSAVFISWLTPGNNNWSNDAFHAHGSADLNHLTTNLSGIDTTIDRYNYMSQVVIANIGSHPSMQDKNASGGLDDAMGETSFVYSDIQALNTQSGHSAAIRPGSYGDIFMYQNVTKNSTGDNGAPTVLSFDPSRMDYKNIGLTASFPSELLGNNERTYANEQTPPSDVYFAESFKNWQFDTSKMTVEKGSVDMRYGVLGTPDHPLSGHGSLPIFTPTNSNGVVVSRSFTNSLNKIVSVDMFDRYHSNNLSDKNGVNPPDEINQHSFLRVDDGANVLGVGADDYTSKSYYVVQKGNQTIETNVPRIFGWHKLTMDFSSGTDVKISIDGQQVANYKSTDAVPLSFKYVGMGDWGPSWVGTKQTGGSSYFADLYVYGGQTAPAPHPLVSTPPTALSSTTLYSEDFTSYTLGSTSVPTNWVTNSGYGTPPHNMTYKIMSDPSNSSGNVLQITSDNNSMYAYRTTAWSNYTFSGRMKLVSWSGGTTSSTDSFALAVATTASGGINPDRYLFGYQRATSTLKIWKVSNGILSTVLDITPPSGFDPTQWNTYALQLINGNLVVSINDSQVGSVSIGNVSGGLDIDSNNATFYIDDLKVTQNPIVAPTADVQSGSYATAQDVKVTVPTGINAYYTTDGSDPAIKGILYRSAINIANSSTLKVVSESGGYYSETVAYNYYIGSTIASPSAVTVNKQPLNDSIAIASSASGGNIPTATLNAFTTALANAKAIYNDYNATNTDVISATAALQTAYAHLQPTVLPRIGSFADMFSSSTSTPLLSVVNNPLIATNTTGVGVTNSSPYAMYQQGGITMYMNSVPAWSNYTMSFDFLMGDWNTASSTTLYGANEGVNFSLYANLNNNSPTYVIPQYQVFLNHSSNNAMNLNIKGLQTTFTATSKSLPASFADTKATTPRIGTRADNNGMAVWHHFDITVSNTAGITVSIDNGAITATNPNAKTLTGGTFGFNTFNADFYIGNLQIINNSTGENYLNWDFNDGKMPANQVISTNNTTSALTVPTNISAPIVNQASGTYVNPIVVSVTPSASSDNIYYTLDDTDPTTNGTRLTGPIAINKSCTLKVVEADSNGNYSPVSSFSYIITNPTSAQPIAITNPRSQTVVGAQTVSFQTLAYSPDGGTLTYQWQSSTDGTSWNNISGATESAYTTPSQVTVADDGTQYRCIITNSNGSLEPAKYTSTATLNVASAPYGTSTSGLVISAGNVVPSDSIANGKNGPTGTALVSFTTNAAGSYYYQVDYSGVFGDSPPTINTSGTGTACLAGTNTISVPNLAPYVPYTIYVQEKDSQGKLSNILKMDIRSGTPTLSYSTSGDGTVTHGSAGRYLSGTAMPIVATPNEGAYFLNWTASNGGVFADANSASTEFATSFYDNIVTANFYNVSSFNATVTGTVYGGTNTTLTIDIEGTNLNNPGAAVGMYVLVDGKSYVVTAGKQTVNVLVPSSGNHMTVQLYDQKGNLLGTTNIPIVNSTPKTLEAITTPTPVTGVANGTAKTADDLGLPATVQLVTDTENVAASVVWDVDASDYDPADKAAQTFTVKGTVTLPEGVANPNNVDLTVSISVTVDAKTVKETTVRLTAPASVMKGDSFTVRLGLKQLHEPIYAQDMLVKYDPNLYEFQDAVPMREGLTVYKQPAQAPGQLRLIIASLGADHAITSDADVVELKFAAKQVSQSASGSIAVTSATIGDAEGHERGALPASVTVEVTTTSELPGDVNHDGKYSIADLAIAAAHYGMTQQHPDWNKYKSADVDSNGVIDIVDLAAIARKIIES
ncbi:FN3 associated domain-containing protein [Paenibacillus sp. GCM10027629]|uniref:FN3 associated domain-containing protein n=1 Tax=Paenibacillus sp. GCM10027629 TaxID=3273414 RepID=UPI003626E7CD